MSKKLKGSVNMKYSNCSIFCEGMEFKCPLCRTIVRSGEHHTCNKPTFNSAIKVENAASKRAEQ